jgi:hypothetical protein
VLGVGSGGACRGVQHRLDLFAEVVDDGPVLRATLIPHGIGRYLPKPCMSSLGLVSAAFAFREKFREPLALALAAYPEARVSIEESGMVLYPSAPPVPEGRASPTARLPLRQTKG